jgi:hypothetical protein
MDLKKRVDSLESAVAELKDMIKILCEDNKAKEDTIKRLKEYNAKCNE